MQAQNYFPRPETAFAFAAGSGAGPQRPSCCAPSLMPQFWATTLIALTTGFLLGHALSGQLLVGPPLRETACACVFPPLPACFAAFFGLCRSRLQIYFPLLFRALALSLPLHPPQDWNHFARRATQVSAASPSIPIAGEDAVHCFRASSSLSTLLLLVDPGLRGVSCGCEPSCLHACFSTWLIHLRVQLACLHLALTC